ncbi:hypothetical protein H0H81_006155 [Sphagnurus paluster]|uniref:F-box domain-containing protein n=1 Tax=Sphagnurus paluster TaxID=117069 RepID=A0A9P7GSE2_9AGAR|nr:hypothetical protein H0H81_006155 [Sphagnurus paluster]
MRPHITTIPQELSDAIALELTLVEPLGPPAVLLPLMATCRTLYARLSPHTNPVLHAAIFRQKFDSAAVTRRHDGACPTARAYVDQLYRYLAALRVFRRGNVHEGVRDGLWGDEVLDISLDEALQIAVVMMMEDDGKNARQLLLWGHADVFVKRLLRRRLYAGAEAQDGWPLEDEVNTNALWVLWLLTSEESLLRETQQERESITQLLIPFIYAPFRYSTFYAPPEHFLIPPTTDPSTTQPSTIPTLHGPYPIYPPPSTVISVHYGTRPALGRPPAALAAVLSFYARTEVTARPIAPHLDRTRADRTARGVHPDELGPTREDVEELNWAWVARPPLGAGLLQRDGTRALVPAWGGAEYAPAENYDDLDAELKFPERPRGIEYPSPHAPIERWVGKAPHSPPPKAGKSVRWDADWARLRLCSDMWVPRGSTRGCGLGYVHVPGSLDGLWTGLMQLSSEMALQQLLGDARHPRHGTFTEEALTAASQPVSVWLREVRKVGGSRCCCRGRGEVEAGPKPAAAAIWVNDDEEYESEYEDDEDFGEEEDDDDDEVSTDDDEEEEEQKPQPADNPDDYFALACDVAGINNAWFEGEGPPVFVPASSSSSTASSHPSFPSHSHSHASSSSHAHPTATEYNVRPVGSSTITAFRTHPRSHRRQAQRLGNDALQPEYDSDMDVDVDMDADADSDSGPSRCEACAAPRKSTSASTRWREQDERAREALFASVGMGSPPPPPSSTPHPHPSSSHTPSSQTQTQTQTHDILLVGSTDPASALAWHPFTYHGRVRPWDGLVALVRVPKRARDEHLGRAVFCGYVVGGECFVGSWRVGGAGGGGAGDAGNAAGLGQGVLPGGVFCWSRRRD